MAKRKDEDGSVRQRIKRKAATEQEAIKFCKLALKAWEKEFKRDTIYKVLILDKCMFLRYNTYICLEAL